MFTVCILSCTTIQEVLKFWHITQMLSYVDDDGIIDNFIYKINMLQKQSMMILLIHLIADHDSNKLQCGVSYTCCLFQWHPCISPCNYQEGVVLYKISQNNNFITLFFLFIHIFLMLLHCAVVMSNRPHIVGMNSSNSRV